VQIGKVSFRFAYEAYYKYLGKLQQPKSNFSQLKQPHSNLRRVTNTLKLGTCCGKPQFQLALIFVIVDAVKSTTKM